jgi:hypothetical protein
VSQFTTTFIGETRGGAFMRWALLVALCFAGLFSARADAPPTGTNRFLFIVDTSAVMKNWEDPAREALFDFIYSGVRGTMTDGDSYGVWLAGGANDTSAGMETWKQRFAVELASRAALRVKERGAKGKPALDVALADAAQIAQRVGDLTVIIISNGDTPLHGTPFDVAINAQTIKLAPSMREAKSTINTVLAVQAGQFTAWSLNSPDFLVVMPKLPERPKSAAPAPSVAKTEPSPAQEPVSKPAVVAKPRPAAKPIVITRETVEREKQAIRSLASIEMSGPAPVTNAPPSTTNAVSAVPAPATNLQTVAAPALKPPHLTNVPVVSPAAITTSISFSHAPASAEVVQVTLEPKTNDAAVAATRQNLSGPAVPIVSNSFPLMLWSAVGGGLLVLIVVAVVFISRSRDPQVSLVTQAAMVERMRR